MTEEVSASMPLETRLPDLGLGRHADVDRANAAGASTTQRATNKFWGHAKWRVSVCAKDAIGSDAADARDDGSAPREPPAASDGSTCQVSLPQDDYGEDVAPSGSCTTCVSKTEVDDGGPEVEPLSEGTRSQENDGGAGATPSAEDALARAVGRSTDKYLEECFSAEAAVLDRRKFESIPEITKADLKITGLLGKGSYCDVVEVVCKGDHKLPCTRHRSTSGKPKFAMKCLRPRISADAEQFHIGASDIIHETALLASLDHRHIIKLHGRASGRVTEAFVPNQRYFILLDRLDETLQDCIDVWKQVGRTAQGPTAAKMEVTRAVADAGAYVHAKQIVLRDIKPTNIGFDATGVTKLFDLGFAVSLPKRDKTNPTGLLYDLCGTMRYMAPEIGQGKGYGTPADVYSLGVVLWELCALEPPFSGLDTVEVFEREVFGRGRRPALDKGWPVAVRELVGRCWSTEPRSRPSMSEIESFCSRQTSLLDR